MHSTNRASFKSSTLRMVTATILICWPLLTGAQASTSPPDKSSNPNKAAPASADNATPATGPAGNAGIETEMLSYEAMNTIAHEIATRIRSAGAGTCGNKALSQDANTISQLTAFGAFDGTTSRLLSAYNHVGRGFVSGGAPSDALTEATGIMTAIRSTAVYTSQTFQPTAASMSNMLTAQLGRLSPPVALYSTAFPGDLLAAADYVNKKLADIDDAQSKIADATQRKDLDTTYSALKTQLASASADGTMMSTVIKGRALVAGLQSPYCVLSYSLDGAGGETRVAHPFLWEVFFPSPSPSYSGGAVVSFVLSTSDGKVLAGDSLRYMFGFSKLKGCKLTAASNFDRKNDPCAAK